MRGLNNQLRLRLEELRDELASLLVDKDEMLNLGYQDLNASYSQKIGRYEIYLFEREYEYIRLQRKVEIVKLYQKGSKEGLDLYSIDQQLDKDYKDFKLRIESRKKIAEESEAYFREGKFSPNNYKLLRSLYWNIVREIHPDIGNTLSEEDKRIYLGASKAFEDKNLQKIQAYEISLSFRDPEPILNEEDIREEIIRVSKNISQTQRYIGSVKKLHPYNKKPLLEDDKAVEAKVIDLEERIKETDLKISDLENQLLDLLIS